MVAVAADEMDQADEEMRIIIKTLWSMQAKKMLDKLVPPKSGKLLKICSNRNMK